MPLSLDGTGSIVGIVTVSVSDDLAHVGDTNTKISFPAADTITAETAGTERLRITSSGEVKIMNTSGTVGLYFQSSSGAVSNFRAIGTNNQSLGYFFGNTEKVRFDSSGRLLIGTTTEGNSSADNLTIADSGESGITVRSGTSQGGHIYFSDATSGTAEYQGLVSYQHNGDFMKFGTAATERLRIDSAGRCIVGGGTHAGGSALVVKGGNQNNYSTVGMFSNHTNPANNTLLSQIRFGANATAVGADMRVYADADWGSSDYPSRIEFHTTPDGSSSKQVRMKISKDGYITKPNQPSFHVTIGGGQINSNVGVIVYTDTTTQINHNIGGHYSTSNGRFTAPIAGKYLIAARMLTNSSTQSYTIYLIRRNGTTIGYIGHNHSDYWMMESGTFVMNLSANDYIDCYLQQHSGHGGYNYASFSGFLLG